MSDDRLPYERRGESTPHSYNLSLEDAEIDYGNNPFRVSERTYTHCFKKLVANFGQYLDQEGVEVAWHLYHEALFALYPDKGDMTREHDAALYQATLAMIRRRDERGMPRVAELRSAIEYYADMNEAYRQTEQVKIKIDAAQAQAIVEGQRRRRRDEQERSDG